MIEEDGVPRVDASGLCAARRALLLGASAAGLALVTGCGGDDGDGGDDAAPTGGSSGASGTGNLPAQGGPTKTPGPATTTEDPFAPFPSGDGPPAGALVETKEVPVGGGVLVREKIVVQPKAGVFKAFSAICPHQQFTVQPPSTGATIMECPGHNSQFRAVDGSLVRGPATSGLKGITVKVDKGYVVEV